MKILLVHPRHTGASVCRGAIEGLSGAADAGAAGQDPAAAGAGDSAQLGGSSAIIAFHAR